MISALIAWRVTTPQHCELDFLLSVFAHISLIVPSFSNLSRIRQLFDVFRFKLSPPLSLYFLNVFVLPVPLQSALRCSNVNLTDINIFIIYNLHVFLSLAHNHAICWENITLQNRSRTVILCHFVPKILTIKEWVHNFSPSVYIVQLSAFLKSNKQYTAYSIILLV